MKIRTLFVTLAIILSYNAKSQKIIFSPNFGQKSHPTLNIDKIELSKNQTIIHISAINKSPEGDWFCVDKKVELIDLENNKKYKISEVRGIPRCPEQYKFTQVGEKMEFILIFPPLPAETKYISIIEKCTNACFRFEGVILDEALNELINEAYDAYAHGLDFKALDLFRQAVAQSPHYPFPFLKENIKKIEKELDSK